MGIIFLLFTFIFLLFNVTDASSNITTTNYDKVGNAIARKLGETYTECSRRVVEPNKWELKQTLFNKNIFKLNPNIFPSPFLV
ncbi:MAG: hypothetical protein QNJ51_29635 [Calothrix sp. MO_167.B12]|nr:hypothetical protein [Calothrix sp. MO_167.B12]